MLPPSTLELPDAIVSCVVPMEGNRISCLVNGHPVLGYFKWAGPKMLAGKLVRVKLGFFNDHPCHPGRTIQVILLTEEVSETS